MVHAKDAVGHTDLVIPDNLYLALEMIQAPMLDRNAPAGLTNEGK